MSRLTQKRLKERLHYDVFSGVFTWLVSPAPTVFIGDIAGWANEGYTQICVDNQAYYASWLAWLYAYGRLPIKGKMIDHIDHNGTNNKLANLREVIEPENHKNLSLYKNSPLGVMGVTPSPNGKVYYARLVCNQRVVLDKGFRTFEEAMKARKAAEKKHGFHENHGKRKV